MGTSAKVHGPRSAHHAKHRWPALYHMHAEACMHESRGMHAWVQAHACELQVRYTHAWMHMHESERQGRCMDAGAARERQGRCMH
eukprot:366128-Chlamydomonas_euryale.AAC.4